MGSKVKERGSSLGQRAIAGGHSLPSSKRLTSKEASAIPRVATAFTPGSCSCVVCSMFQHGLCEISALKQTQPKELFTLLTGTDVM